jgi:Uma2 family endonuclease
MTLHAPMPMTKEAFLAFIDEREERYEFAGGRAVMMVKVTRNHAVVTVNLIVALKQRLSADRYDIASEAFAVNVGPNVRFPDVLVQPRMADGSALEAKSPVLIAEVLSPSTLRTNFGEKRAEYLSLPSLDAYLILSQDQPEVWLWQRRDKEFPSEPERIAGADQSLRLNASGIEIPLAEIYDGVFAPADKSPRA